MISRIEKAYEASSEKFTRAVERLERDVGGVGNATSLFDIMRQKLFMPTLRTLVQENHTIPQVLSNTTARKASQIMLEHNCSAVMVYDDSGDAVGIFTSKDLLRRTLATGRDPSNCLVSDAMTPNPDYASMDTTIVDALHLMHDGKFLHLPILGKDNRVVGLTDVLQVTYGVVNQMGSLSQAADENPNPVWKNFWNSMFDYDDTSTTGSTVASTISTTMEGSPVETSSGSLSREVYRDEFVYKIIDSSGLTHRFTSSADSVLNLMTDVKTRLKHESIVSLNYFDDEGDQVVLLTDEDLKDAVAAARASGKRILRLIFPKRKKEMIHAAQTTKSEKGNGVIQYAAAAAAVALAGVTLAFSRKN